MKPLIILVALVLAACHEQQPVDRHVIDEHKERAQKGPFVSHTVQISPTESVSTLTIPSAFGPLLDQHCLIYRNLEFKTSNMACPAQDFSTSNDQ